MELKVEATYEGGALKLDEPLPLPEGQRVTVVIQPKGGRVRRSAGLIPWTGALADLEQLLGPDNQPWSE
jgi:predicted DNA-binding antitoxin AbrB/MazE fold protein